MLLVLISSFLVSASASELRSELKVDGSPVLTMDAGKASTWEFKFFDTVTGQAPHHYHVMHDKPMHLVVISQDMSSFAHIHPTHFAHMSVPFRVRVNSATADKDNHMLPSAVPFSGRYFLFSEVMPMDYGMLLFRHTIEAKGPERLPLNLVADPVLADGRIEKLFDSEGSPVNDIAQAKYRAFMKIVKVDHCETVYPQLILDFEVRKPESSEFVPLNDLETYLSSYGHALVMGAGGEIAEEKIIQHLHATWPLATGDPINEERGPQVELTAHSHGQSTPTDRYKAWVQIKHQGRVLTLPFVFDWVLPPKADGPDIKILNLVNVFRRKSC